MSSSVLSLLRGYFNEELIHVRPKLRSSLHHGGPEAVARTRAQFDEILRRRTMTSDEFWRATTVYFADEAELYRSLDEAYEFFFGDDPGERDGKATP